MSKETKIAFVTNFCSHYRRKTFELLSRFADIDFYFFSAGDEWYWQQQHGVNSGNFRFKYLPGFRLGKTRITLTLPQELWRGNYDLYIKCINGKFALPITFIIAKIKRKPFILWTGIWTRLMTREHKVLFPLTKFFYQHADAIVTYGDHVKRYLVSENVLSEKIFNTTHAVDNEAYCGAIDGAETEKLRERLNIRPNTKVVLFLGRMEEIKGIPYLVQAFSQLHRQDAVLLLAGDGSRLESIKQMVNYAGVEETVRFSGYVPVHQSLPYYALADVFVLPSITVPQGKETWGLVVNEAFNQGVPVIATAAVGAAAGGLVEDGVNGFIVPERDSNALAQALQKILDNPNLRADMSRNAREKIAAWNNEHMVQGFREAIDYVLEKKKK